MDFLIFVLDYATLEFLLLPHGFSHLASSPFIFDTSHFESTSSLQSFLHLDFLISICNFSRFDVFPSILAYLHLDLLVFSHSSAHTELSSSFFDAVRLASSLSVRSFVCFGFSVLSYGAVNLDALAMKFTRWWQLKYFSMFNPCWGRWTQFDEHNFFRGVGEKPPTRFSTANFSNFLSFSLIGGEFSNEGIWTSKMIQM